MASVPHNPQRELLLNAVTEGHLVNGKPARIIKNSIVEIEVEPGKWRVVQPWAVKIGLRKTQD